VRVILSKFATIFKLETQNDGNLAAKNMTTLAVLMEQMNMTDILATANIAQKLQ